MNNKEKEINIKNVINNLLTELNTFKFEKNKIDKIINSLNNLIEKLVNNNQYQEIIFNLLNEDNLSLILTEMSENPCVNIRKLLCKFIIYILYNNEKIQNNFCENLNFNPISNVVCLNFLPKIFKECIKFNENILYDIKKSQNSSCPNSTYWMYPYNSKYNKNKFPDPAKYLIGFYIIPKIIINFEDRGYSGVNIKEIIEKLERNKNNENNYYEIVTTTASDNITNINNKSVEKKDNNNNLLKKKENFNLNKSNEKNNKIIFENNSKIKNNLGNNIFSKSNSRKCGSNSIEKKFVRLNTTNFYLNMNKNINKLILKNKKTIIKNENKLLKFIEPMKK